MKKDISANRELLLSSVKPAKAIVRLAVPATFALLAKAAYNIVDTAYIGALHSDNALAAVGVSLPLLLITMSIENILSAGAGVLAGQRLGEQNKEGANTVVSTIVGMSFFMGFVLCVLGLVFMDPLLSAFGASDSVLPQARQYAFWMFIAIIFNIPAQTINYAARAESSVKITSIAVISGAALNIVLDPVFMFDWGFGLGVAGASMATTVSQLVSAAILFWHFLSGRSILKLKISAVHPSAKLFRTVIAIGIPSAVFQIFLAVAASLNNIAASIFPDRDLIIAALGVVQRLVLIGCYVIMGFMQGYQPVAAYAFGANNGKRFRDSVRFAFAGTFVLSLLATVIYVIMSKELILLFNRNPVVVKYGSRWLVSQVALFPAFGLCYMMTLTYQTMGSSKLGLLLSAMRQGLFYIPCILLLPRIFGINGMYFSQPAADLPAIIICVIMYPMVPKIALKKMNRTANDPGVPVSL
jgi:putative MATE family efflux protein